MITPTSNTSPSPTVSLQLVIYKRLSCYHYDILTFLRTIHINASISFFFFSNRLMLPLVVILMIASQSLAQSCNTEGHTFNQTAHKHENMMQMMHMMQHRNAKTQIGIYVVVYICQHTHTHMRPCTHSGGLAYNQNHSYINSI